MKLRTTLALAVASLTIGVPAAAADPDGPYQAEPQVMAQPDALDRYLSNNAPKCAAGRARSLPAEQLSAAVGDDRSGHAPRLAPGAAEPGR